MTRRLGNYMPFYYDDFIGGTISFGADEIGAYALLLMHQWANGYIENDPVIIERVARCEYGKLRRVLSKFDIDNDRLTNRKCELVRVERLAFLEKQRKNSEKGGQATKDKYYSPPASPNDSPEHSPDIALSSSSSSSLLSSPSSSKTTTTSSSGGGGSFEIKKGASKTEIINNLLACRPEYTRIARSAWENEFKQTGATIDHIIEAANLFIKADCNRIDALKSPARYFGGILKKVLENAGVQTETWEEKMARIKAESRRK